MQDGSDHLVEELVERKSFREPDNYPAVHSGQHWCEINPSLSTVWTSVRGVPDKVEVTWPVNHLDPDDVAKQAVDDYKKRVKIVDVKPQPNAAGVSELTVTLEVLPPLPSESASSRGTKRSRLTTEKNKRSEEKHITMSYDDAMDVYPELLVEFMMSQTHQEPEFRVDKHPLVVCQYCRVNKQIHKGQKVWVPKSTAKFRKGNREYVIVKNCIRCGSMKLEDLLKECKLDDKENDKEKKDSISESRK